MLKMSRASGAYANTAALYVYREGAWSEYANEDANVVVADPALYADLGADYVSKPANVFPIYLGEGCRGLSDKCRGYDGCNGIYV